MQFKLELISNKTMRTLTFLRKEINFVCFWPLVLAVQLNLIWVSNMASCTHEEL